MYYFGCVLRGLAESATALGGKIFSYATECGQYKACGFYFPENMLVAILRWVELGAQVKFKRISARMGSGASGHRPGKRRVNRDRRD